LVPQTKTNCSFQTFSSQYFQLLKGIALLLSRQFVSFYLTVSSCDSYTIKRRKNGLSVNLAGTTFLLNPLCINLNELQNHPEKHYMYHQDPIESKHIPFSFPFWGRKRFFSEYSCLKEFEKPQQINDTVASFLESEISYLITVDLQKKYRHSSK